MSHPPRLGHRIDAIRFAAGYIDCSCGAHITGDVPPGLDDGDAALEAAWLAHRREVRDSRSYNPYVLGDSTREPAEYQKPRC